MNYSLSGRPRNRNLLLNRDIFLGQEMARGGEGKIYSIVGKKNEVAKIFHKPTAEKAAKLNEMLAHPPRDPTAKQLDHISIAWPTAQILDNTGTCIGFTMPYIDRKETFPLLRLYNPRDRRETGINFTWRYLLRIVLNLASILKALHRKGYVIGDLNESNVLVTKKALVTLVDCDSIQVPMKGSGWRRIFWWVFWRRDYFRCTVGKPEYTPPELQGRDFSETNRKTYHDNFSLAVLIFLMLMEGWHPFAAAWKGQGVAPSLEQNMEAVTFPYTGRLKKLRPKYALQLEILPPPLLHLMIKCFVRRHRRPWYHWRPGANAWFKALKRAEQYLTICSKNQSHVYSDHLRRCPWCERVAAGMPDPFPPAAGVQAEREQPRVSQLKRAQQTLFILLSLLLYGIEIYCSRFYGQWFVQTTPQMRLIAVLLFLLIPVMVFLVLKTRYRSR